MKEFIKKHLLKIIFSVAGGVTGLLYWKFVGCTSGTCLIKSIWYMSTLYGLLLGFLFGGLTEEIIILIRKHKKS